MEVIRMKFRRYIIKAFLLAGIWSMINVSPGILSAATNSDYAAMPPFMSTSIEPNVLIVLDNSGSMNDEAYATTYDPTQFSSGQYYGLFDATKYYQYTGTRWEPVTGTTTTMCSITTATTCNTTSNCPSGETCVTRPIPATGPSGAASTGNPIASGNLLNWATMSRISVAKKLLIGGKGNPRSWNGSVSVKLEGETTWGFLKTFDNTSSANLITPFTGNYRYTVSSTARLSMVPVSAGTSTIYTSPNANISIPAGWTVFPAASTAWQDVDDTISPTISNDGDATYIQAQSTASPAMFDYNYTGGNIGSITNVGVRVIAKSNCSTSVLRRTRAVLRISGVDYDSGYISIGTTYPATASPFNWATNPATLAAWQWSDIKSSGVGSLEAFGVRPNQSNAGCYHRVTQVYLVVTSSTPSGGPYSIIIDQGNIDARGIIDNLTDEARFGLAYYASNSNGGRVEEYVGFGATNNMVTSIGNLVANTWTPLGETLYEMTRYFRQETPYYSNSPADYQTGVNYDPYWFRYTTKAGSSLADQYVPCAKSFILMLTDGESTQDTSIPGTSTSSPYAACSLTNIKACSGYGGLPNPRFGGTSIGQTYSSSGTDYLTDVAYWARTEDARPGSCTATPTSWQQCLPGTQNVIIYPVFMFGSGSTLLKDAAIYGGFKDMDGDNKPDCSTEPRECYRDSDGDGTVESNGQDDPITYFEGDDGFELEASITNAIASIVQESASGTSVSILATSAEGEGALYQAYFYPDKDMADFTKRIWLGYCRGLFVDVDGNMRDDYTNGGSKDAALIYSQDRILRMRLDTSTNEVNADLYLDTDENGQPDGSPTTILIDDVMALWEAGEKLARRDKSTRNIYTWVDSDNDGVVDNGDFSSFSGEALAFVNNDATNNNATALKPYLNAASITEADNIIDFMRGNNVTGYPNRCVPVTPEAGLSIESGCTGASAIGEDAGKVERVWTLGDIIYSTPTTVGPTKEQYDQIYGIASYTNFRIKYNNRRHIVYVGANDGMLHAFNAGVYIPGDKSGTSAIEHGRFLTNPSGSDGVDTDGDGADSDFDGWGASLGSELWAFMPYDNLPHLKWQTSTSYAHVYYTDLKPKPTDVRIFCDATNTDTGANCVNGQSSVSHPGGWGTILIMGMKYGGGAMDVTADFDNNAGTADTTRTFRSAYYALDVTNPEKPPRLLWRFTDANLGFTTSYPGIAHICSGGTCPGTGTEKWFMVVGSGPDNNAPAGTRGYSGTSTQQARVYAVNLLTGANTFTFTNLGTNNGGTQLDANAFMGDPTIVDGDLDFTTDVIYMGSAISTTGGKVFRINTNQSTAPANWALSTLFNDTGVGPVLVGPSVSKDRFNNFWVFFGTGRFISTDDKVDSDQQTFYGIKDACWQKNTTATPCSTTYSRALLFNSSTIAVCTAAGGGGIYDTTTGSCTSTTYSSYTDFLTTVRAASGWYLNLNNPTTTPSERVISRGVVIGGVLLFTSFIPNSDICAMLGDSNLYALYYETGTAYNKPVIGESGTTILRTKSLGKGMPTTVGVAIGKKAKGYIQTSTGTIVEVEVEPAISVRSGPAGWREKTGGGGTSEIEEIYKHIVK
jgi:type IV pilus assembly protein PilY1